MASNTPKKTPSSQRASLSRLQQQAAESVKGSPAQLKASGSDPAKNGWRKLGKRV